MSDAAALSDRITGCLLAGAVGDALGAGIEFDSLAAIQEAYGPSGVTGYVPAYGRTGAITDDTQMTMFTTEGLIRASVRERTRGGVGHDVPVVLRHAYLRWLHTQHYPWPPPGPPTIDSSGPDGWLASVAALYSLRAPGSTCTMALESGRLGTVDDLINTSKGCGGVMRAAPAGFLDLPTRDRFHLGCDVAAITHGHPTGYLTAGFLAGVIGALVDGEDLDDAMDETIAVLRLWDDHEETLAAVEEGRRSAAAGLPSLEQMRSLGEGWVADEALKMSIACAAAGADFRTTMLTAVNHSGDSDSTGSITGNILGAMHGLAVVPPEWLAGLELREELLELAHDAAAELRGDPRSDGGVTATDDWLRRYPGW